MSAPVVDPIARFFEKLLPALVLKQFDSFLEQDGCISFDVTGAGQWSFTFGTEEPIATGLDPDAGLKLTFTRGAFDKFIDGTLDVIEAVQKKEVTARGREFILLENFGRLLRPPQRHDLGWDASTVG
ncbi:MAG: hypothetical protein H6Q89_5133 [Myxococcaceae bacterium]|nr:hypothetical protein [Myxococcaceae bacterium]